MNNELKKFMKLMNVDKMSDEKQSSISREISNIIKTNLLTEEHRYNKLFQLMKVNDLNRETKNEIREKLDEILPKIRFEWIESKNKNSSKNLHEIYYPKKEDTSSVKKMNKNEFIWNTNYSREINESMESWMNVWGGRYKIYVDENNRVLHTDTYLVNIGDKLSEQQIEYLKQKGIVFILKQTGE